MLKLIKLELQRINLRTYIISSAVSGAVLLAFTYFISYVAQVEKETQFMTYGNIFMFTGLMSILVFGILSASMYAKLIIEEYSGKRLALLFSYPVGRQKVFAAKILIVFVFAAVSMMLCTILPIFIFTVTESFIPIVSDTLTSDILIKAIGNMLVSLAAVSAIGALAMRIGFIKKSVTATLISAFILSGVYGNIASGSAGDFTISLLIIGISVIAVLTVFITLSQKIKHMEAE